MDPESATARQRFLLKAHWYAALAVWVTMLGSVGLYLLFVWLAVWRPHIAWWWLSAGLVVLSAVTSLALMIYQLFGRDRIRGIGVFMVSFVPLVWLAAFLWSTISLIESRGDLKLTTPLRALGIWVGSYFELEARWRCPRVTEGKHVMLFDDGSTPNVRSLVAEMDKHIEKMAAILETPIPKVKARWIRSTLFGLHGRAIGAWAICIDENPGELQHLDLHEVAHVTLTTMCPVSQDMPMLLAEGWAEMQSQNQPRMILSLCKSKEREQSLELNDIVTNSYGRSAGPAYHHGGPLVMYLIERFGGATFVELYGSVQRETFAADVERVTGVSWAQLESDFWVWLESRREWAKSAVKESNTNSLFSFDRESDKAPWQEILASARQTTEAISVPETVALVQKETSDSWNAETNYVFEGDCMWVVSEASTDSSSTRYQIATPEVCGQFVRHETNVSRDSGWSSSPYKNVTRSKRAFLFGYNELSRFLMVDLSEMDAGSGLQIQIHSIERLTDSPFWKLCFTSSFDPDSDSDNAQKMEATLDPAKHFNVVEMAELENDSRRIHKLETEELRGVPIVARWTTSGDKDASFTRTIAELTPEQATQVKETVESAIASVPEPPVQTPVVDKKNWRKAFVTPSVLAIGWPLLGLAFLLTDFLCDRIRWKAS